MNPIPEDMTLDQLIKRFAEVGVEQDDVIFKEKVHKFKQSFHEMAAIDRELIKRGPEARLGLLRLYDHPNIQVRLQAAKCSRDVAPLEARQVFQEISRSAQMPQAADARAALRDMDEGTYRRG
jgi:hypothetical protein